MPIYEFHCNDCQKDSEMLVRSADWTGSKCPHCGSAELAKKLSVFASASSSGGSGSNEAPFCPNSPTGRCSCGGGGSHSH